MKRARKNIVPSSDEESDVGSKSADSDNTVSISRPAPQKKATARKRGPPTKKKAQKLQDDSDSESTQPNSTPKANNDQSEDEDDSDSDYTVSNSRPALQKKATARKRGLPAKKKAQKSQDDSDSESTQPNSPKANDLQSEDEDDSDSDYVANSTKRSKKGRGKQSLPSNKKKQRLQYGVSRNTSPQPSTSYHDQNGSSQNVHSEEESEEDSADSDYGLFNEKSIVKPKKPTEKQLPQRAAKKTGTNYANSNLKRSADNSSQSSASLKQNLKKSADNSSQLSASLKQKLKISADNSSELNASLKQGSKIHQYDPSTDAKLVDTVAHRLVYFLFIEDQKKYAIRRKSIVTNVFKDDYHPKLYNAVIKKANVILKKTYGMELMELENQKDSYIIVNILGRELGIHDYVDLPRLKQQQYGLIMILLAVIYMNDNVITEDELTRCLKPLGVDLTSKRLHPVFGDVKKYITTELVKQMYLNYNCVTKEPPVYEFTWGLRAKQEFDKRDLLQFVCTIMGDTAPEDWRMQFRDAEASAKPNTD